MNSVVAILGVSQDNTSGTNERIFNIGITNDFKTMTCRRMPERALINELIRSKSKLVNAKITQKGIEDSLGSFNRFKARGGKFIPVVLLAIYKSEAGRVLGYVVASQAGVISRVKRDDLINYCREAKASFDIAFIQNAIYREKDGVHQIAEYEEGNIPVITKPNEAQQRRAQRPAEPVAKTPTPEVKEVQEPVRPVTPAPAPIPTPVAQPRVMSPAQNKELEACKNAGVNPRLIDSPKLRPEQQRVIWAAKQNGVSAEYFTNPKFTKEQMIFFADRLESDERFRECISFVDPKYSVEQLKQLYLGVCSGIDLTDMLDETLTPEEMYVKRIEKESELYDDIVSLCSLPDDVCVRNLARKRGWLEDTKTASPDEDMN